METRKNTQYTRKIVQTSVFIALALVIRSLSYMIYIGGAPGMSISFSGIFTKFPAILFGPLYGGIAAGILDVLGYMMNPIGAYIPWLTVTAIISGVMIGFIWKLLKNIDVKKIQRGLLILFISIGMIGVINHISVLFFYDSFWAKSIVSIGKNKDFATIGLEVISVIGVALLIIDLIIQKRITNSSIYQNYLKLIIVTGIAGIIVTTLNTYILQLFIPSLGKIGFLVFWIPRIVQEMFMVVIQGYIVAFLLSIYNKLPSNIE